MIQLGCEKKNGAGKPWDLNELNSHFCSGVTRGKSVLETRSGPD
jgi:hypothetical protein